MTPAQAIEAVAPVAEAILPATSSRIERALLSAELARLATVDPRVIATIWDPATCPVELLPWLAQGVSVDVWSNGWDEDRKRQVIAASPMVHRLKGTLGAVRRALAAFDLETRIIEWWEDGERRGTFRVEVVYRNGSPIFDIETQGYAIEAVDAAKPKSRVFTTRAALEARGRLYIAAYGRTALSATAHPYAFDPPVLRASAFVGATAATLISATAHSRPS